MINAVTYYLKNYDTIVFNGKTVRSILGDTDLYIIPMFNPDGIAISQFGLAGLRTQAARDRVRAIYESNVSAGNTGASFSDYLRVWRANSNGVDLNRNFRFDLTGKIYNNGITAPAGGEYKGNPNQPENETAAYYTLLRSLSNPVAVVSFHSQGNLIYWKCGQDRQGLAAAQSLAETIQDVTGYYLDMNNSFTAASADWVMLEKGIPAVTVESGRGSNPLPIRDQSGIFASLRDVLLAVAEKY